MLTPELIDAWDRTPAAPDDEPPPPSSRSSDRKKNTRKRAAQNHHGAKRQSRLRFEVLNAFVDTSMANLMRSELAVWLVLCRDTKPDGTARASFDDIARRAGIDRRSVTRAIGTLKRKKLLQVVRKGGLNRGPSTCRVFPYPME